MYKPISLFIGLRYTKAKQKNHFISIISLISMIGMILGVAVMITVLSVMNGFERELKNRILGMIPNATVMSTDWVEDWPSWVNKAEQNKAVEAAAPYTQLQAMITANGQVTGLLVHGINEQYEQKVSIVQNHMVKGSIASLKTGEFGIVIGQALANNLGVLVGDKVTLVLPEATPSPAGVIPRFKRFTVVGVYAISNEVDSMLAYIDLNDAAALLHLPNGAQGIRLKMYNIFDAPKVSAQLALQMGDFAYATDWTQTHGNLFATIKLEKTMLGLLLFLIVLVAAFNIISSLVMLVTDKTSDVAILRTLGMSQKKVMQIFMVQGCFIGFVGTLVGTIIGVIVSLTVGHFLTWLDQTLHLGLFNAYFIQYLPTELNWLQVLLVCTASLLLSFLSTLYPSRKAAKIQPAEALRYE